MFHSDILLSGLGRTGVLIACYLVYSLRIRANDAIRLVRKKRPRSVQTSGQILCVQQFEHYMLPQTIVFSSKEGIMLTKDRKSSEFTLRQHLHRQRATLHGLDERSFKLLPKIIYCICERLLTLCGCQRSAGGDFLIRNKPFYKSFIGYKLKVTHPPDPLIEDEMLTEETSTQPMIEWRSPVEEDIERNLEAVSRINGAPITQSHTALQIYEAFLVDHHSLPDEKQKYLKKLRTEINQKREAIGKIEEEEDPVVLIGLISEWLEGLRIPVLDREDLAIIVGRGHDLDYCLSALTLEDVILVEYLIRFVIRLRPLSSNKKVDIIKRLVACLSHRPAMISGQWLPARKDFTHLRDGTCSQVVNFMLRFVLRIQEDMVKSTCNGDDSDVVVHKKRQPIKAWK